MVAAGEPDGGTSGCPLVTGTGQITRGCGRTEPRRLIGRHLPEDGAGGQASVQGAGRGVLSGQEAPCVVSAQPFFEPGRGCP